MPHGRVIELLVLHQHDKFAGRTYVLDFRRADGGLARHAAAEDDAIANGAHEGAGELIAVNEDEDVAASRRRGF